MKNLIIIPVLLFLDFLPFSGQESYTFSMLTTQQCSGNQLRKITGRIPGMAPGQLVLLQSSERITIDSVKTGRGGFVLERQLTEPGLYYILLAKTRREVQLIWDGDIVIEGAHLDPQEVIVKGSPLTEELVAYQRRSTNPKRTELIRLSQEANSLYMKGDTAGRFKMLVAQYDSVMTSSFTAAKTYIAQHPNSFVSLQLLDWSWRRIGSEALLRSLSPVLQQHSLARRLNEGLRLDEATAQVGTLLPPFSLPDLDGNRLSTKDLAGKYTLIDFWGTWCAPCVALIPELGRVHATMNPDSVQFVGFDCERGASNPGAIRQFLKRRGVDWRQLSIEMGDSTSVDKQWEILAFPTFILVGPDQRVLVRGTGTEGLNACVERLARYRKR